MLPWLAEEFSGPARRNSTSIAIPYRQPCIYQLPGMTPTLSSREYALVSWTLRILSGISEGICNTMVQSGGEFLYIGVGGR